jgi:hypothetical protein
MTEPTGMPIATDDMLGELSTEEILSTDEVGDHREG